MGTRLINVGLLLLSIPLLLISCQNADDREDLVERRIDVNGIWRIETESGYKASSALVRIEEGDQYEVDPTLYALNGTFLKQATCTHGGDELDKLFDNTSINKSSTDYSISGAMAFCPSQFFRDNCENLTGHDEVIFEPFGTQKVGTWVIRGTYQSLRLEVTGPGTCQVTDTLNNRFRLIRASCPLDRNEEAPEEMGEKEYRDFLKDMVKEGIGQAGGGPVVTIGDGIEQIDAARCLPEKLITGINNLPRDPENFAKCNEFCGEWADWVSSVSNRGNKQAMQDCMAECTRRPQ